MNKRNYNPLNEGYSGVNISLEGYKGKKIQMDGVTGSQGTAPTTLPKIHNAVVKSNQNNTNGQKSNKS